MSEDISIDQTTIRDLMAMFAMQGLLAQGGVAGMDVSKYSYNVASKMLEERAKRKEGPNE
jgi:hypothetical protein